MLALVHSCPWANENTQRASEAIFCMHKQAQLLSALCKMLDLRSLSQLMSFAVTCYWSCKCRLYERQPLGHTLMYRPYVDVKQLQIRASAITMSRATPALSSKSPGTAYSASKPSASQQQSCWKSQAGNLEITQVFCPGQTIATIKLHVMLQAHNSSRATDH